MTTKITKSLYKGDIEIDFLPNSHTYKIKKERILSVSGISGVMDKSAPLMIWATGLMAEELKGVKKPNYDDIDNARWAYKRKKEEACSIGEEVHQWAENFVKAKMSNKDQDLILPEDINIKAGVVAFLQWDKSNNIQYIESERLVYSRKHNFVGIFDCLANINGKLTLIDFKTSKRFYPMEMGMQLAGYQIAYEEEIGQVDQRMVVRFDKETGEFESHILQNNKADKEAFLSALKLKQREKEIKNEYNLIK